MAYVLGFIVADGALIHTKRDTFFTEIQSTDKEIIYDIRSCMELDLKVGEVCRTRPGWKKAYRLQIGSKRIYKDLESLGLFPRKSMNIRLPPVPSKHFASFLRGYFDGDGSVSLLVPRSRNSKSPVLTTRFTSGSKMILVEIKDRLRRSISVSGSLCYYSRAWRLVYATKDSEKLFYYMYSKKTVDGNKDLICLRRKRIIYQRAFMQP